VLTDIFLSALFVHFFVQFDVLSSSSLRMRICCLVGPIAEYGMAPAVNTGRAFVADTHSRMYRSAGDSLDR